jgi:ornithine cyclodeaminase/alanine dehydrogenase-like protein (mu-crystallin family)
MPLLLSESDVRQVLPMGDLIDAMQVALEEFSARRVEQPLRTVLDVGPQHAFFGVMPAFIPATGALGTKLVTVFGSNASVGLPSHLATIVLLDSSTGQLRAFMDGRYITEARTAAVSAVSSRLLARRGASKLAIIGSGVQARSHLEAMTHVHRLNEIRVWSPNADHLRAFIDDMQPAMSTAIRAASSADEAVKDAEVVVLVSAAREPVVRSEWIADGTHLCAVGACRPDQREMDSALVSRARLFVDSRTAAVVEAGDIVIPIREGTIRPAHIAGELGELVAGRIVGRESKAQVTLFKSLGMAVEDVAAAHLAFNRATERGLGRELL